MLKNNYKKILISIVIFLSLSFFSFPNISQAATSVTQYGITWTFDGDYTVGQFVNGDYYVIDPGTGVRIININPGYTDTPRVMNGSMINPTSIPQGYDGTRDYSSVVNVGIGVSPSTPLVLNLGDSLVSTISVDTVVDGNASYVKDAAVLTCLNSAPPPGTFRPGISGTAKTLHNKSSLNLSLLKKLPLPAGIEIPASALTVCAQQFQMVWLDHNHLFSSRNLHPANSGLDNYYFPIKFSECSLVLHNNFSDAEKDALLTNFIQIGIDLYSYLESGGIGWLPNGGHSSGRKWPILFSGIMLDYAPMKNIGQISGDYLYAVNGRGPGNAPVGYKYFSEDDQTFYVTQADLDITRGSTWVSDTWRMGGRKLSFDVNSNIFTIATPPLDAIIGPWNPDTRNEDINGNVLCRPYSVEMLGMPEWGIRHASEPQSSESTWGASYRTIGSGAPAWMGTSLAARFMNAKELWNHDAHFDYLDRYKAIAKGLPDPFGYVVAQERAGGESVSSFINSMWDTYRADYGDVIAPDPPANLTVL